MSARGTTLACAESLTAGLLADAFVQVPGSSAVFRGGIVAYATDLKASLLGVDVDLLVRNGPVDPEVARQMARGAAIRMQADLGIATTGVAGPEPQGNINVGTVYVAVAGTWRSTELASVRAYHFSGERAEIRHQAVDAALDLLARVILETH